MTIKELILFNVIIATFAFIVWGLTTIRQDMITDGVEALAIEVSKLEERVIAIEKAVKVKVSVSAYNACPKQTDSTPFIMASGKRVYEGAIALSRDIEKDFGLKFGDEVTLIGIGTFQFLDRMNKKMKRCAYIFMWSEKEALQFGRQEAVMVIRG